LLHPDKNNPEIMQLMFMAAMIELEELRRKNSLYAILLPIMLIVGVGIGYTVARI